MPDLVWIASFVGDVWRELLHAVDLACRPEATCGELRRSAWLAVVAGDIGAARIWLERAAQQPEDRGEAWFASGLLHLSRSQHEPAREAFIAAASARLTGDALENALADIRSYDPGVDRFAIFRVLYDQFEHAFCCFLIPDRIKETEHQGYAFCFERALNNLRPLPLWFPVLEKEREINGETMWYWLSLGHIHWMAGRRADADTAYRRARELALSQGIIPYHFDCGAMVWMRREETEGLLDDGEAKARARMSTSAWTYRFPAPQARAPEMALVLGADRCYFDYFPKFLLSLVEAKLADQANHSAAIHVHVAGPDPDQLEFLENVSSAIQREIPDLVVSFSSGKSDFEEASYYTCLRFLVLPEILSHYQCGAMALDIDSLVTPDFFDHLSHIASFDLGLRMYNFTSETQQQVGGEPWSIGAHPTYVANTGIGRHFAELLRKYVSAAYDPQLPTNWTIDQCAIAQAYDLLIRSNRDCRVLNFAYYRAVYRLPHEFGGKQQLLDFGGRVTMDNFHQCLNAALSARPRRA